MNEFLKCALHYASIGWKIFPIQPGQKTPLTAHGVKDATADPAIINGWWTKWPNANIAVACGEASGVFVVDVDVTASGDINGIDSLKEFPMLPPTVLQNTPRGGFHAFYKTDRAPANRNSFRPGIDIRGNGYYVVLAPSIHPNGGSYRWGDNLAPGEIAVAEYPEFMRPVTRAPWAATANVSSPIAPTTQGYSDDTIRRASLYLAQCDPAIQGCGGHDRLLWAAKAMVEGFLLSDSQAYDLLAREYNPRCVPPWDLGQVADEKDFRRKVSEARKLSPQRSPGWLLEDTTYAPVETSNIDVERLIANSLPRQAEAGEAIGKQQSSSKIIYPAWTAAKLMDMNCNIHYLVKNFLAALQPCLVGGSKKTLKTSTVIDLAISLATAGYFLGVFKVPQAVRVGLMTGESGLGTVQETIRRICKTAEIDPLTIDRLFITDRIPRLEDSEHLQALKDFIIEHVLEVLIIDPVYLAMSGADAGNIFKQGERLRTISEICSALNVTLILVHHTRKNGANQTPFAMPELDDLAWAGFAEFARQWILLGRRKAYIPGTGEHPLWLTVGGSAGHSGAWGLDVFEGNREDEGGRVWKTKVEPASEIIEAEKDRRNQGKALVKRAAHDDHCKRIWTWLYAQPEGATKNKISVATGINNRLTGEAIESLLENGNIESCEVQKRPGYRVIREPETKDVSQVSLFP